MDTDQDLEGMRLAIDQAAIGLSEGGMPIGAALVAAGQAIGVGHNRLAQWESPLRHAEIDCLENAGVDAAESYGASTLYTTLSPCQMCAGAVLLCGIPRVVVGENRNWRSSEQLLMDNGVEVVVLDLAECHVPMADFISRRPDLWPWQ